MIHKLYIITNIQWKMIEAPQLHHWLYVLKDVLMFYHVNKVVHSLNLTENQNSYEQNKDMANWVQLTLTFP